MKFVKVNYQGAVDKHLTPRINVYNSLEEQTMVGNFQNNGCNVINLTNTKKLTIYAEPSDDKNFTTKSYVDSFSEVERSRRALCLIKNDHYEDI